MRPRLAFDVLLRRAKAPRPDRARRPGAYMRWFRARRRLGFPTRTPPTTSPAARRYMRTYMRQYRQGQRRRTEIKHDN